MTKPTLLTREQWWYASEIGVLHHYNFGPFQDFVDATYFWREWCKELNRFEGNDLYEKHVNWYNVRYSKLGMALK